MSNTQSVRWTSAVAACLAAAALAAPARAADEEPAGVKTFKQTVEAEAKTILRAAHPLGKYKDIALDSYKTAGGKHELTYTVRWAGKEKGEEKDFATTFLFAVQFGEGDQVGGLEVSVPKDTCPSRAFRGADIAAGVFRAQVKKRMSAVTDDRELIEKIDKLDGEALLAVWLKHAGRKPKK